MGLIVLLCTLLVAIGCERAPRTADAVFAEWRGIADQDKRQHLAKEMIRDGHLIGWTRERVEEVLGKSNPRRM